jgi:hypothetical protein
VPRFLATRTFDTAVLERPLDGESIETPGFAGWGVARTRRSRCRWRGASRAEVTPALVAVLLQHGDTKAKQQLICPPGQVRRDAKGNETCGMARLSCRTSAPPSAKGPTGRQGKVDLERWRRSAIWKDANRCVGRVTPFLNASL